MRGIASILLMLACLHGLATAFGDPLKAALYAGAIFLAGLLAPA